MALYGKQMTICYVAWDTANKAGKTGDAANHTLRWIKDGASSAPTNTPSEVDSTNAPGLYKLTITATEAQCPFGVLAGKSSTSGVVIAPIAVSFERLPDADPATSGGLPTVGTGSGQLNPSSGNVTLAAATHTGAVIPTVTDVSNLHASAATAANQTTILNRLGAITGSGVNTVLGFFKAIASKTATLPSDIGGTFDPATDSTEAIRDRGDAAWSTATGFPLAADWTPTRAGKIDNLDAAISSRGTGTALDAAGVRSAVGLASANLDTQLDSIPTAAEIKTAMEADGGKLDHLWEMTEDDVGVRRFTTNSLENAPAGGGGTTDWTAGEKEQIRSALGIDGTKTAATGGQLQALDSIADSILEDTGTTIPAQVAALNNMSSADAQTAAAAALTAVGLNSTVTGRIDTTVSSRLATSGYTAPPSAATVADAVWDEILSGHAIVGSCGAALSAAGGSGDPWATALPGAYGAGTAGYIIGSGTGGGTTVALPVMQASVYTTVALTTRKVKVARNDTPRVYFDFGADTDWTGWTVWFGAKASTDDTAYAIAPKEGAWTDAAAGQGYIDLAATDTATAGTYTAEIELRNGDSRITPIQYQLVIVPDVIVPA